MGSSGGSVALRAAGAAWTLWARCGQPRAQTIVSSSAAAWWSSPAQTAQVSTSAACGQDNSQPKLAIRLNDNLESRIAKITQRFQTLEQQLQGSDGAGQQLSGSQLQEAMKEYRRVQPVGSKYVEYQRLQQELRDVKSLLQPAATPPTPSTPSTPATGDEELRQMAEEEVQVLAGRLRSMEHELLLALLPSAQDEHMGAILEVRAGTGGEEAALFAADLVRMYQSYADQKGWQWELLEQSSAEAGGLKFASAAVTGGGAFSRLRHEAGVHRVQRVPSTEREGRVHTSTASVVVLPEADEMEFVVREEDARIKALTHPHEADSIGLGQYRKKFMHNIVDGRMLLMLSDDQMKAELGIGPMGHRVALLRAIENLLDEFDAAQGGGSPPRDAWRGSSSHERPASARPSSAARGRPPASEHPRRPASASPNVVPPDRYLGPAAGKVTVYEQRSKLLFELDRAAARAAQQKAVADQLAHTANLTEEEVLRLRALLQDLERKNRMEVQHSGGTLDSHSRIPWRPVGTGSKVINPNPERLARPGEDPTVDMTFKPRLSKETRRMFSEQSANKSTFLDRLENDLRKRDRSKRELDRKYYSAEALFQDPMLAKKEKDRDLNFLKDYFAAKNLLDAPLSDRQDERDDQLNEVIGNYADSWKLKDKQVHAVTSSKGDKKVKAMASAVRAMLFMQRYESELRQREDKLLALQKKWWELSMGRPQAKEDEDRKQLVEYFGMLGWKGEGEEGVTESRLNALLARARAYKKEWEVWREKNRDRPADAVGEPPALVKWSEPPWTVDGLQPLMDAEMQRIRDAAESRPVPPTGKTVTTKHAGDGTVAVSQMVAGEGLDYLTYTVKLLAGLRWDSLERLEGLGDERVKRLAVYRGVRTQKFLEFTENKIKERERSMAELYNTMVPQRRAISRNQQDGFFERLLDDANKRRARVEKMLGEKMAKEKEILGSTKLYARRTTR